MDFSAAADGGRQLLHTLSPLVWLDGHADTLRCAVTALPADQLDEWLVEGQPAYLRRGSGGFFKIGAIEVSSSFGPLRHWQQPIAEQFEIGLLGLILRYGLEGPELLIQAKGEPGDINGVQAAPTVQATRSNYRTVHKGRPPPFAKTAFASKAEAIVNRLQPEHGSFFLRKYNRNVAISVKEEKDHPPNFRWMTLQDLALLFDHPNRVNMSLRSALASLFGNDLPAPLPAWFRDYAGSGAMQLGRIDWHADIAAPHIEVIGVAVSAPAREVASWQQPMLAGPVGRVDLLMRHTRENDEFLLRATPEPGHRKWLAIGPSWCSYTSDAGDPVRSALGLQIAELSGHILYDQFLSEDGGRFNRFQNRYRVLEIEGGEIGHLPPGYGWVRASTLRSWLASRLLTMELRSLLAWYFLRLASNDSSGMANKILPEYPGVNPCNIAS